MSPNLGKIHLHQYKQNILYHNILEHLLISYFNRIEIVAFIIIDISVSFLFFSKYVSVFVRNRDRNRISSVHHQIKMEKI